MAPQRRRGRYALGVASLAVAAAVVASGAAYALPPLRESSAVGRQGTPVDTAGSAREVSIPAALEPTEHCASSRRLVASALLAVAAELVRAPTAEAKRPEGVNRPELLPNTDGDKTPVIDLAKILSDRQRGIIERQVAEVEEASGVRLRVLAQTYPMSPGLAIKPYWKLDSKTVVYVHDTGGLGKDVVNFNVGDSVVPKKPVTVWRQIQNKYGNKFYLQEHGDSDTMMDVVQAVHDLFVFKPEESA